MSLLFIKANECDQTEIPCIHNNPQNVILTQDPVVVTGDMTAASFISLLTQAIKDTGLWALFSLSLTCTNITLTCLQGCDVIHLSNFSILISGTLLQLEHRSTDLL